MKRFAGLIVMAILVVVASYFVLVANPDLTSRWFAAESEITVRVVPVRRSSVPAIISVAGEVSSAQTVNIVSRLAGKVTEVRFKVGDAVPAGAVVARIHAGALAARVSELETALDAARRDLKSRQELAARAAGQLAQAREWQRQDLIARREFEQAEAAAETARAQEELARAHMEQQAAMLAQARSLEKLTQLSAPFSGVITHRWAEPGASIAELAPVLTIGDPRKLKMFVSYSGPHVDEVGVGMSLEITSAQAPARVFHGKITRIESASNDAKQFHEIEIEIDSNEANIRPGAAAQAVISLKKQEEVLLVPKPAVVLRDGKTYVYKVVGGRALRQEVTVAGTHGQEVAIQGVNNGDLVITDNQDALKPNGAVRTLTEPARATLEAR